MTSQHSSRIAHLRTALDSEGLTVVPGVVDGATAKLLELHGFRIALVSGSMTALSVAALADEGLLTAKQLLDTVGRLSEASNLSLLVDIDNGYGELSENVRLAKQLVAANAAGVILEDSIIPPPRVGTPLLSANEMIGKIRGIKEVFGSSGPLLVARTNARSVCTIEDCISRLILYKEAGADAVFLFRPKEPEDLRAVSRQLELPQVAVLPKTSRQLAGFLGPREHGTVKIALAPSICYLAALDRFRSMLEKLRSGNYFIQQDECRAQDQLLKQLTSAPKTE